MLEKVVRTMELLPHSPWEKGRERVILIHGLFLYGSVMKPIGKFLAGENFSPLLYDYPTMRHTVEEHGEMLAEFLENHFREAQENSYTGKTSFVTHSMGGIILRKALSLLAAPERKKVGNIVMIAPPNRGSDVAKNSLKLLPFPAKYIKPLPGLSSEADSYARRGEMPEEFLARIGILGAGSDLMVREEYTILPGAKERVFLPGHHTPILFKKETKEAVLAFLRNGEFPPGMERR